MAAVCAYFSGFKRRENSCFFGSLSWSITASGTVKSAASGTVRPLKVTVSVASGSSKERTQRRPSKCATTVTL